MRQGCAHLITVATQEAVVDILLEFLCNKVTDISNNIETRMKHNLTGGEVGHGLFVDEQTLAVALDHEHQAGEGHDGEGGAHHDQQITARKVLARSRIEALRQVFAVEGNVRLHQALARLAAQNIVGLSSVEDALLHPLEADRPPTSLVDAMSRVEGTVSLHQLVLVHACQPLERVDVLRVDAQHFALVLAHSHEVMAGRRTKGAREEFACQMEEWLWIVPKEGYVEDCLRVGQVVLGQLRKEARVGRTEVGNARS